MRMHVWISALLVVGFSLPVSAENDETPEREEQSFLFLLEEAYTQHRRQVQVTPAMTFTTHRGTELEIGEDGDVETIRQRKQRVRWPVDVEYGVTDRLEAQLGVSFIYEQTDATRVGTENRDTQHDEDFEDLELGARYKLLNESVQAPAVSVGYTLELPTGDQHGAFGSEHAGHEWVALLSRDFGSWVAHLNLGFGVRVNETMRNEDGTISPKHDLRELAYGIGAVYRMTDQWKGFLELTHEFSEEIQANARKSETALTILPGLSYTATAPWGDRGDAWELGLGIPVGLTRDAPDWGVIIRLRHEHQF